MAPVSPARGGVGRGLRTGAKQRGRVLATGGRGGVARSDGEVDWVWLTAWIYMRVRTYGRVSLHATAPQNSEVNFIFFTVVESNWWLFVGASHYAASPKSASRHFPTRALCSATAMSCMHANIGLQSAAGKAPQPPEQLTFKDLAQEPICWACGDCHHQPVDGAVVSRHGKVAHESSFI